MPKFAVELERISARDASANPFVPLHIDLNSRVGVVVRKWEMECKDEAEVRRFLKEAQDQNHPNVRGFQLRSIKQLDQPPSQKGEA